MPFQCCASVKDIGTTLKQHWVNASCLLGCCPYTRSVIFVAGFTLHGVVIWRLRLLVENDSKAQCSNNIMLRYLTGYDPETLRKT